MATLLNPQPLPLTRARALPLKLPLNRPFCCPLRPSLRTMGSYFSTPVANSSSVSTIAAGIDQSAVDVLQNVTVLSAGNDESVLFKDLLDQKEGMTVVALLRHFGCICCWELASVLRDSRPRFDAAGIKLVAIGIGTPDKARVLAEGLPFPLDCLYAAPDRKAYDALGLHYGFGRTFLNPASIKVFSRFDSIKAAGRNYTISATPDDKSSVLQQGGMLVFKGKQLLYARKDEGTGDHAPLDEIFDICSKVSVA